MTKGFWALLLVMCGMAGGQPTTGGHFRSGSIAWLKLDGNEVEFEIMAEWKRSYSGNYKLGAPANSSIFVGDKINIQGAKSPRLLFGDGAFTYLVSEVGGLHTYLCLHIAESPSSHSSHTPCCPSDSSVP